MSEKLLLTFEEAAERLSLGRSVFYELVRAGEIAITYVGPSRTMRRVHVDDLRAYADALRREAATAADRNGDRDADRNSGGRQRTADWGRRISLARRARNRAWADDIVGPMDRIGEV